VSSKIQKPRSFWRVNYLNLFKQSRFPKSHVHEVTLKWKCAILAFYDSYTWTSVCCLRAPIWPGKFSGKKMLPYGEKSDGLRNFPSPAVWRESYNQPTVISQTQRGRGGGGVPPCISYMGIVFDPFSVRKRDRILTILVWKSENRFCFSTNQVWIKWVCILEAISENRHIA